MKGLILSAGLGSRFRQHTQNQHKLLLTVNGVPIIDYALQAFFRAGIYEVGLVTGFMADHISDWVGNGSRYGLKVEYVFNPDYTLGNAISLQVAQIFTGDEAFVLSMGDHMVSHGLISRVQEFNECEGNVLGVDFGLDMRHAHDATRKQPTNAPQPKCGSITYGCSRSRLANHREAIWPLAYCNGSSGPLGY